jgi:hypothetical protein
MEITNDQIREVFDKATHMADVAYVVERFFSDGNATFHKAMAEAYNADEEDISLKDIRKLEEIDEGHKSYKCPEHAMCRWDENTGDEGDSMYYKIDKEMKEIGLNLLPFAQALAKDVDKDILNLLVLHYARATEFVGCMGEKNYAEMLEGKKDYQPYYPFSHGVFATQVKKLCKVVAEKRGFKIQEVEGLNFEKVVQERIKQKEKAEKEKTIYHPH